MTWAEFFSMDGYAAFVWPSYALGVAAFVGLWARARAKLRRAERDVAQLEGRMS